MDNGYIFPIMTKQFYDSDEVLYKCLQNSGRQHDDPWSKWRCKSTFWIVILLYLQLVNITASVNLQKTSYIRNIV